MYFCFEETDRFSLKLTWKLKVHEQIQFWLWQSGFSKELILPLKTTVKAEQNTFNKHLKVLEEYQIGMT